MQFQHLDVPQGSPDWHKCRLGRVTASRLCDWLAVSKKDGKTPLKAREDYEREIWFEQTFGVAFNNYVTDAMADGIQYEELAAQEYEKKTKRKVESCGVWYSDTFAASPDRLAGKEGLLEIKILRDASFTDVLLSGVPEKHWMQIQGQLFATRRAWCDYVALNLSTKAFTIIRVTPDQEFFKRLEESLQEIRITVKENYPTYPVSSEIKQEVTEEAVWN